MDRTINPIDISFDPRFEFDIFYEDQKEEGCVRLFHINTCKV